jgi:hypothetical protein
LAVVALLAGVAAVPLAADPLTFAATGVATGTLSEIGLTTGTLVGTGAGVRITDGAELFFATAFVATFLATGVDAPAEDAAVDEEAAVDEAAGFFDFLSDFLPAPDAFDLPPDAVLPLPALSAAFFSAAALPAATFLPAAALPDAAFSDPAVSDAAFADATDPEAADPDAADAARKSRSSS